MKKIIFGFILGLVVAGGIAGVVAYNYSAKDMGYEPSDNTWEVDNVKDALGSLYTKSKMYQKLDQTTTVNASKLLNGETAYDSNGNLITGTYSDKCVSGSGSITSDFKTSTGGLLFEFVPSEFYMFFGNGQSTFYINGMYESKVWSLNTNNASWQNNSGYFIAKNGKYYGINWSAANGTKFNYVACR